MVVGLAGLPGLTATSGAAAADKDDRGEPNQIMFSYLNKIIKLDN